VPIEELQLDIAEVQSLLQSSTRQSVKAVLQVHVTRLQEQLKRQEDIVATGDRLLESAVKMIAAADFERARLNIRHSTA